MQVRWTVLAAALVLVAPVAAQEQAQFSLEQKDAPAEAELRGGESLEMTMGVNLTGEGFSCTAEVQAPVNVTVEASLPSDAPPNASLTPTNASKTFPIPAGEYETQPYSQEANATVSVEAGSGLTENTTGTLTITSTFPGGNYSDCVPMEFAPASSDPAEVSVSLIADDPPEPEEDEEPTDNETVEENTTAPADNASTNASEEDEGNGIAVPWQIAPLAAIGAALLPRDRRREA